MSSFLYGKKVVIFILVAVAIICVLGASLLIIRAIPQYSIVSGKFVWSHTRIASLATLLAPRDAALRFEIGNYYFGGEAHDTTKAENYFRETLELDPLLQGPHYQLARIYFVQGDFYDATREINKELASL